MYQAPESSYQPDQHNQGQHFMEMPGSGNEAQVQMGSYNNMNNNSDGYNTAQPTASSSQTCDVTYISSIMLFINYIFVSFIVLISITDLSQ